MRGENGFYFIRIAENPFSNPPILKEKIMITNEQLDNVLLHLKNDGISYKYIANISNIPYDTFYFYRRCRNYPLDARIAIEESIKNRFGEYIDEYCK